MHFHSLQSFFFSYLLAHLIFKLTLWIDRVDIIFPIFKIRKLKFKEHDLQK